MTGDALMIALGGNCITRVGEKGTIEEQWSRADETMAEIAALWERLRMPLIITHGNGPQIGRILLRSELASKEVDPLPLDVAVADSEAGMGYMIQQLLGNHINRRGHDMKSVTIVTRVEVDPADSAFTDPTKPIGLFYTEDEARDLQRVRGWEMRDDPGRGWRRVVPSPMPLRVIESKVIADVVASGNIIIALGGGGVPVIKTPGGDLQGCECVIDKDLASALLAETLGVRTLAIITGVPRVCLDWGMPTEREVGRLTASEAQEHFDAGQFPAGSMGPKILAAIRVARWGGRTIITQPGDIEAALDGRAGTWVVPDGETT